MSVIGGESKLLRLRLPCLLPAGLKLRPCSQVRLAIWHSRGILPKPRQLSVAICRHPQYYNMLVHMPTRKTLTVLTALQARKDPSLVTCR